jgi:hypothetical protein
LPLYCLGCWRSPGLTLAPNLLRRCAAARLKRANFRGRTAPVGWIYVLSHYGWATWMGDKICVRLILFWCSAVVGQCGCNNSRFGPFNSRLGQANSRFGLLREFAHKTLISLTLCTAKRRLHGRNR